MAAAAVQPLQRPQDLVALWLVALPWPADSRWKPSSRSEIYSGHLLSLLAVLRSHVATLRAAGSAGAAGAVLLSFEPYTLRPRP